MPAAGPLPHGPGNGPQGQRRAAAGGVGRVLKTVASPRFSVKLKPRALLRRRPALPQLPAELRPYLNHG